jgi:DNA-binding transcriptional ArsR family regulator
VSNLLLVPGPVEVKIALDPVYNNLATLYMISSVNLRSGFSDWIEQVAAGLSPEQRRTQRLMGSLLYSAYEPDEDFPTFPAFLDHLAAQDPLQMRHEFLRYMFPEIGERYIQQQRLMDLDTFMAEIDRSEMDHEIEPEIFAEALALLNDLPAMRARIVAYLREMWQDILAAEWERNLPLLRQVVAAFQSQSYAGLTGYEAIRAVTGRDAGGSWQRILGPAERLVFIPSAHIGPYLLNAYNKHKRVKIVFGARLPAGTKHIPTELTHADLLIQLRALADETRLRILELIFEAGELCAQDVISRLKLTKSSASRHLSQLSAVGYLTEHQREGKTKCYTLNPGCFHETMRSLERYAKDKTLETRS